MVGLHARADELVRVGNGAGEDLGEARGEEGVGVGQLRCRCRAAASV